MCQLAEEGGLLPWPAGAVAAGLGIRGWACARPLARHHRPPPPLPLQAKMASDVNKPNGQFSLPPDRQAILEYMRALEIRCASPGGWAVVVVSGVVVVAATLVVVVVVSVCVWWWVCYPP